MAGDSSSEAKMKELVFFSAYLTTLFQMVLNHRRFNDLQILQKSGQIERVDLLTFESECAISCNLGTSSRIQMKSANAVRTIFDS
jgi:hypothetical protein